jgi:hypothetical protein
MRLIRVGFALVFSLSCGDPAEPALHHPLEGTYTIDASLTTYVWSTSTFGSAEPPDCPTAGIYYCQHFRTLTGATLAGTFVLQATGGDSLFVSGEFGGDFCGAAGPTACTALSPMPVQTYTAFLRVRYGGDSTLSVNLAVPYGGLQPGMGMGARLSLTSMRAAGDSLVGTLLWAKTPGVHGQEQRGTFVARR